MHRVLLWAFAGGLVACSSSDPARQPAPASQNPAARIEASPSPAPEGAARPKIVVLGDSLTAGLGLPREQAFPSMLQRRLHVEGYPYEVVNAGVSGDTSAGGLRRLDWVLDDRVRVLVIELGANDGLRGLPTAQLEANLDEIITRAKARDVRVLLTGMEAPPNFGPHYTAAFRKTYRDLAEKHDVPLLPFFLDGVAGIRALNNEDGLHPNLDGTRIVEGNVWRMLEPLLDRSPS